jgi:hypothetical protein
VERKGKEKAERKEKEGGENERKRRRRKGKKKKEEKTNSDKRNEKIQKIFYLGIDGCARVRGKVMTSELVQKSSEIGISVHYF